MVFVYMSILLNLELGWWLANPGDPLVSVSLSVGVIQAQLSCSKFYIDACLTSRLML